MFNQSMYSVNEDAGPAQAVLVISNPSSTDITVQVTNTDGSAIGEYCSTVYHKTFEWKNFIIFYIFDSISNFSTNYGLVDQQ